MESDLDRLSPVRLTWTPSEPHRHTIEVEGDVDRADAERLEHLATTVLSSGLALDIDVARVGVFGSAALRALDVAGRLATRVGVSLKLVNRPDHVDRMLNAIGVEPDIAPGRPVEQDTTGRLLITSTDFDRVVAQGVLHGRESVIVTTTDMEHPGPEIVFANRAFTDLTGYSADEVLGRSPRLLQGDLTDRKVLDRLRSDVLDARPFTGEAVNYRRDGSPFIMSWRVVSVAGSRGLPDYLIAMQTDVTELRRLHRFETALTYLDSQSAAMAAADIPDDERHHRLLEAIVAAEVSLMGAGEAVARLRRRDGSRIVTTTDAQRYDPDDDRLFALDAATSRSSNVDLETVLHIPVQLRPKSSFVGGEIIVMGMHRDHLAMADARLHEQLATHAAERGF